MIELCTFGDFGPRRGEERLTETERNGSGHDSKSEVEKIGHARDRTANEHARAFDHFC